MSTISAVIIPDNATVLEAAKLAVASHLHLITDGRRVLLSPIVMPGWHRMAVKVKSSPLEPHGASAVCRLTLALKGYFLMQRTWRAAWAMSVRHSFYNDQVTRPFPAQGE